MMRWFKCENIMPGERCDSQKNPSSDMTKFLICYHDKEDDVINPELGICMAYLYCGKFVPLLLESPYALDKSTISHWMQIELP
jgi:hypothetical protein